MHDLHHNSGIRGLGGGLVALAAALFAQHAGMPAWQVFAVFLLVAIGLPMAIGGRLRNW